MNWYPATFTIPSGQTTSNVIDVSTTYNYTNHSYRYLFAVPPTVSETLVFQVSFDNVIFVTLQSGAVDIDLPSNKATQVYGVMCRYARIQATVNVGGTRVIQASVAAE
ncbi:MAG: hypothetical protein ACRCZI_00630 [Cetobacterium sp.]